MNHGPSTYTPGLSGSQSLRAEADTYLSDPVRHNTSILMFWQVSAHGIFIKVLVNTKFQKNQKWYPTIFSLALDILSIQGTSVLSEHIFSSVKGPGLEFYRWVGWSFADSETWGTYGLANIDSWRYAGFYQASSIVENFLIDWFPFLIISRR